MVSTTPMDIHPSSASTIGSARRVIRTSSDSERNGSAAFRVTVFMKMKHANLGAVLALFSAAASAQVSSNQSLKGNFYFRQVMLITDSAANVTDTRSAWGTLTFDGSGGFTIAGQQMAGTAAPTALSGSGTYAVSPGGFASLTSPIKAGTINARLGTGALVGSSTETVAGTFDLFLAIPAPAQSTSSQTLSGAYWISSLEFPNGGSTNVRNTNFKLTAN